MTTVRELPTVLQLDVAGNAQKWITYEDSAYHYAKGNVAWSMGAVDFDIRGGTCALTGERSILCLLYTSPSPRDVEESRMPSSA